MPTTCGVVAVLAKVIGCGGHENVSNPCLIHMNVYLQVLLISSKNLSSVQGSRSGRAYNFIVFMLSSSFSILKVQLQFVISDTNPNNICRYRFV